MDKIDKILEKYKGKLGERIELEKMERFPEEFFSREYRIFRKEALERKLTLYESLCNLFEKVITVKPSEKDREKIQESIDRCHLNMSVNGAMAFAVLVGIAIVLLGIGIGIVSFLLENLMVVVPLILMLAGVLLIKPLSLYPKRLADQWRLKASNQMVLCILYIVIYMKHTSNLEHAIKFAGEHVGAPLSLDLRKIFWDVEIEKFLSIKESLDNYLEGWKDYNLEFVESFHLIEGSLYEPSEKRRVELLEKALEVMLEGTYEKMLHYAHDLKTPITMLHMLGVILPLLALVIFPLIGSFLKGAIRWYHLAFLYNILLPIIVFGFGTNLLSKRPTGYGESETSEPKAEHFKLFGVYLDPKTVAVFICLLLACFGFLPIIVNFIYPGEFNTAEFLGGRFLDYKDGYGPYGMWALIFSLFVPAGIAFGLGSYLWIKTRNSILVRKKTLRLEQEFSGALFQLGNRVADGIPVELAFGNVARNMAGTPSGNFFRIVDSNIRKLGMGVKEAIFNPVRGAVLYYPSALIKSSMKVLVESAKKGPMVVSKSLITISDYVNRIHKVNERLKDLLADIISSMKSQISFLMPMIAGIVVGVSFMIVTIINKLGEAFAGAEVAGAEMGGAAGLIGIMNIKEVIPSFHFQLIIGLYVVELVIILTILSVGIEKGIDKITEKYEMSKNLFISVGLYLIITLVSVIIFNVLASGISAVTTAVG